MTDDNQLTPWKAVNLSIKEAWQDKAYIEVLLGIIFYPAFLILAVYFKCKYSK